jgi:hypothetical protein
MTLGLRCENYRWMGIAWEIIRGGKHSCSATVLVRNHNDERPNVICSELRQCGRETQVRTLLLAVRDDASQNKDVQSSTAQPD